MLNSFRLIADRWPLTAFQTTKATSDSFRLTAKVALLAWWFAMVVNRLRTSGTLVHCDSPERSRFVSLALRASVKDDVWFSRLDLAGGRAGGLW